MRERTEQRRRVFDALKQAVKVKGLTYKTLGERIGMSESGIKKIFGNMDCSLDRLFELAEAVGVSLSELMKLAAEPQIELVSMTTPQQEWLLEHLEHFEWLWWLVTEQGGAKAIRARHGRTIAQMRRSLDALEEQGLIELGLEDEVKVRVSGVLRWEDGGPLLDVLDRAWSRGVVEDALEGGAHRLHQLELSVEHYEELSSELDELADRYMRRAHADRLLVHERQRVVCRALLACAPGRFEVASLEDHVEQSITSDR